MSYLIDTNVLSELRRKNPDPKVVAWFAERAAQSLFLSVLTLGEIRKGIERLDTAIGDEVRKQNLSDWLEQDLPTFFLGRLLGIDAGIADRWGHLQAKVGRPLPAIDSLLAATALHHNLTLVTRNVKDFADMGVDLINPWGFGESSQ
ncbi:MAG: type II toxin-antitoxin system VapC family toxin [Burkholderiaceae bacterium]|nr:type II toxin-antitoxin system VapC family toxin [Burkholderiaceae bacterium]